MNVITRVPLPPALLRSTPCNSSLSSSLLNLTNPPSPRLDHFTILTRSGVVLWSRSFTPTPSPLDALLRLALIEHRSSTSLSSSSSVSHWTHDSHALLWTTDNALDLIFVLAHQRILNLPYVEGLLLKVREAFVERYEDTVREIGASLKGGEVGRRLLGRRGNGWAGLFEGWENTFMGLVKDAERGAAKNKHRSKLIQGVDAPESTTETPVLPQSESYLSVRDPNLTSKEDSLGPAAKSDSPTEAGGATSSAEIARNIAALRARQLAGSKKGRNGAGTGTGSRTGTTTASGSEADDSDTNVVKVPPKKQATKWSDSKVTAADLAAYDYSTPSTPSSPSSAPTPAPSSSLLSPSALGTRSSTGAYSVADFLVRAPPPSSSSTPSTTTPTSTPNPSLFTTLLSTLSLTPRQLTSSDLAPALKAMTDHLMSKNVARSIAEKVTKAVGEELVGKEVGGRLGGVGGSGTGAGSGRVKALVRDAMENCLRGILTPRSSVDLLREVLEKKNNLHVPSSAAAGIGKSSSSSTNGRSSTNGHSKKDPYTITFVGVNGVGKSTNLSKVAFWLLQNRQNVLIAACDTFRSGAVEQLRVHVENLGRLNEVGREGLGKGQGDREGGRIELFEKGYGKDAAGIAKEAIAFGKENGFDVVLIDTAGRMQDNEPLMRALAKLVSVNNPDKIIFVGEALVGNEAVDQLEKFDLALKDFSGAVKMGPGGETGRRGIDGIILTKFDTIDDKVGAALSMTYVTGQPILFVGTGQTYSDLRALRVAHIVQALLQD